jgi:hypothetical protein
MLGWLDPFPTGIAIAAYDSVITADGAIGPS